MNRVDPRTGMITSKRGLRRIERLGSSPSRKARADNSQQLSLMPGNLKEMARDIGKEIGDAVKEALRGVILKDLEGENDRRFKSAHLNSVVQELAPINNDPMIKIDESIIDVGIGETKELIKGNASRALTKDKTRKDDSLRASRDKLKSLRRGRI